MRNNSTILSILHTKFSNNLVSRNFNLIKINNEIRWVIENDSSTISVLEEWRPYNKIKNFFWKLLIILQRSRLINLLPICNNKQLKISEDFLNFNKKLDFRKTSIVCFFARASHINQKAIIFLINKEKQECSYIIKKAISKRSWESLQNEYLVLKNLENDKNKYSPLALDLDKANKSIVQEFIKGKPSSLNLHKEHYSFLASLANKNKYLHLKNLRYLINSFFEKEIKFSSNKRLIGEFEKALSLSIWREQIKSVRIHGDFTPWNMKIEFKTKKLKVFDWEDSVNSFLPFYDLFFYKLSVEKLLKKKVKIDINKYICALALNGYNLKEAYINDVILISRIYFFLKSDFNLPRDDFCI